MAITSAASTTHYFCPALRSRSLLDDGTEGDILEEWVPRKCTVKQWQELLPLRISSALDPVFPTGLVRIEYEKFKVSEHLLFHPESLQELLENNVGGGQCGGYYGTYLDIEKGLLNGEKLQLWHVCVDRRDGVSNIDRYVKPYSQETEVSSAVRCIEGYKDRCESRCGEHPGYLKFDDGTFSGHCREAICAQSRTHDGESLQEWQLQGPRFVFDHCISRLAPCRTCAFRWVHYSFVCQASKITMRFIVWDPELQGVDVDHAFQDASKERKSHFIVEVMYATEHKTPNTAHVPLGCRRPRFEHDAAFPAGFTIYE